MDAMSDPEIEEVIFMAPAQIGKTEAILNAIGYYIDQDPSPILAVIATLDLAKAFSKDRLSPMFRDTPALQNKVTDSKTRDGDNTILHKVFSGGHVTLTGANSPASLSSRPIRIVSLDEVDKYPPGAVELAKKRATTFWNRKFFLTSTPLEKSTSTIERAYLASDRRKYHVPCYFCETPLILKWSMVKWEKEHSKPIFESAHLECPKCKEKTYDAERIEMVRNGKWIAERETKKKAGFWLNQLYSAWVPLSSTVEEFYEKKDSPETFQTFINEVLAETWEEGTNEIDDTALSSRCEDFGNTIPANVLVLTLAVDIQVDRFEMELVGWGVNEESYGIEYKILYGNPSQQQIWQDLEEYITQTFQYINGFQMIISAVAIDSGYKTDEVYAFALQKQSRIVHGQKQRIIVIKGSKDATAPIIPARASRVGPQKRIPLWNIGVNQAKDLLNNRLQLQKTGSGYMHFSLNYDDQYFKQFTNEYVKMDKGIRRWIPRREGLKVEAIDIKNYGLAALRIGIFKTMKPNWDKILKQHQQRIEKVQREKEEIDIPVIEKDRPVIKRKFKGGKRRGFVSSW